MLYSFEVCPQFVVVAFSRLYGGLRQSVFNLSDEGTHAEVAVHTHRFDFAFFLVGIGQVVVAEDTGFGVVVVFPHVCFAIPLLFFTERRTARVFGAAIGIAVADTNQTVSDITGRLDFDVAVADGIAAFVITCAPDEVFGAFTAFAADVVINTAGAWIPAFKRCPVFKGAILGTPPDQVGAEFFLVFGFVARGSRFPDAFVAVADGIAVVG